jgi:hypothetical protein
MSVNFLFQQFNHSETNQSQEIMLLPASIRQDLETVPWVGSNGNYDFFLIPFEGDIQETELIEDVFYSTSDWLNLGNCVCIRCNSNDRYLFAPFLVDLMEENLEEPIDSILYVRNLWRNRWSRRNTLTLSSVKGLFGELLILTRLIESYGNQAIQFWNGPEGSIHDFHVNENRIEVKTSTSSNPQIKVSDTMQLIPLEYGTLYVCLIEITQGIGSNISELIGNVRSMISDEVHENLFLRKISYLGSEEEFSNFQQLFVERNLSFIEMDENTPILQLDLLSQFPSSISEVIYTIDSSQLNLTELPEFFWSSL